MKTVRLLVLGLGLISQAAFGELPSPTPIPNPVMPPLGLPMPLPPSATPIVQPTPMPGPNISTAWANQISQSTQACAERPGQLSGGQDSIACPVGVNMVSSTWSSDACQATYQYPPGVERVYGQPPPPGSILKGYAFRCRVNCTWTSNTVIPPGSDSYSKFPPKCLRHDDASRYVSGCERVLPINPPSNWSENGRFVERPTLAACETARGSLAQVCPLVPIFASAAAQCENHVRLITGNENDPLAQYVEFPGGGTCCD